MPHLEAIAADEEPTVSMRDFKLALTIGQAWAVESELSHAAESLRTIEDVRELMDRASHHLRNELINDHQYDKVWDVARLKKIELAEAVTVQGCPAWCNAHDLMYGDNPVDDLSLHRHLVEGEGWVIELEEDEPGGPVVLVDQDRQEIPLSEVRAYARALAAACATVEGTPLTAP
jgi:hypothetical protein